ncbi:MAG: CARDB domain-containing protein [Minisyncoccota bacterium]
MGAGGGGGYGGGGGGGTGLGTGGGGGSSYFSPSLTAGGGSVSIPVSLIGTSVYLGSGIGGSGPVLLGGASPNGTPGTITMSWIDPPPVNGSCSPTHYNCTAGTSINQVDNGTTWTWSCAGSGGGTTASCSETEPLPDLAAGATTATPSSVTTGQPQSFSATVSNDPGAATATNFPNVFQIVNSDYSVTIDRVDTGLVTSLAGGASTPISGSYTFSKPGIYHVRACTNMNASGGNPVITESDTGDSCAGWTDLTVLSPVSVSCTVPSSTGDTTSPNNSFTWTATASGGTNSYPSYTWSGDGISGGSVTNSNSNVTTTYTTPSTPNNYNISVKVTDSNGNSSPTVYCTSPAYSGPPEPTSPSSGTGVTVYPTPTVTLTNDGPINSGQKANLTWSSKNTTYPGSFCTGTGFSTGGATGNPTPDTVSTGSLTTTSSYSVTCSNPGGSATANTTVTVNQPNLPITANPARVASGGQSTITWSASHVDSCQVTGPTGIIIASGSATSGNFSTGSPYTATNITQQSVFTISCKIKNSSVTPSKSVIVNILPVFQQF